MSRTPHLPAVGIYAYMTVFYSTGGKLLSFKLWWTGSTAPTTSYDPDTAAAALFTSFSGQLTPCWAVDVSMHAYKLSVRSGLMQWSGTQYSSLQGTASPDSLPDLANVIIRRVTDSPGASARGRIRLAGVPKGFATDNYLTAAAITAYVSLCTAWKGAVTDQGIIWSPANFSSKLGVLHAAINFIPDSIIGTDRRRKIRI